MMSIGLADELIVDTEQACLMRKMFVFGAFGSKMKEGSRIRPDPLQGYVRQQACGLFRKMMKAM